MPDRSIRNVPITRRRSPVQEEYVRDFGYPPPPPPSSRRPRYILWGILVIIIAALLGAGLSYYFAGATVTIVPRTASVTPTGTITATLDAPSPEFAFQQISITASTTRVVPATGTSQVNSSAQGTITIYNKYSTSPQTLVATTRFESPTGLIYRIHQTVIVPGEKTAADGGTSPGSVTATAYADQPGDSYNTGATQFSIPGFKGGPRYNGFYASTDGMSGGGSGTAPSISASDSAKAKSDMQTELKNILAQESLSKIPEGSIAIPGAAISYSSVSSSGQGNAATLAESATETLAIVKSSDLASAIAAQGVQGYNGEPVDFVSPSSVSVAAASYSADTDSIDLTIAQPVTLVWQIDPAKIQQALAGKSKSQFDSLMQQFKPAAASATASLHPFWSTSFPSNPAKIKVQVQPAQ